MLETKNQRHAYDFETVPIFVFNRNQPLGFVINTVVSVELNANC